MLFEESVELVSEELNHFGVIANLFRQIGLAERESDDVTDCIQFKTSGLNIQII